jgi:hypothetical protein
VKLLLIGSADLPEEFDWEEIDSMYVVEGVEIDEDDAAQVPTYFVTSDPGAVSEDLLNALADLVTDENPLDYVISRGIHGDIAVMQWDDSDDAYAILERLNKAGVTVMDASDGWTEVVIDKSVSFEDLIEVIVARVTADVLKTVRAELDTPGRRGRFRSPAPRP